MSIKIAKTTILDDSPSRSITEITGCYSDQTLIVIAKVNNRLSMQALFKHEMIDANGIYQGSLHPGRWSPETVFTDNRDDSSPTMVMSGGEPLLLLWDRNGQLYTAPSTIREGISSSQVQSDGSFNVALANPGGKYTRNSSEQAGLFANEKLAAIYMGYDGDLVRMATGQFDSSKGVKAPDSATFTPNYKNKYADLIGLQMSKRYSAIYPTGPKSTMVTGFSPSKPIPAGKVVEVKINAPALHRWYPGSPAVESVTGAGSENLIIIGPYGASETFCFLRIGNAGDTDVTPSINIKAVDCSNLATKVSSGRSLAILADHSQAFDYYTFDESVSEDKKIRVVPTSYQINITAISGSGPVTWDSQKITILNSVYYYQVVVFDPAANGVGVQILLFDATGAVKTISNGMTITFDIYGREYVSINGVKVKPPFGRFWSAREVLLDIAKIASRKELMLVSSDDVIDEDRLKLRAGEYSTSLFLSIEEKFDLETLRVVNTGTTELQMDIVDAGYIYNDVAEPEQEWGIRIAVTRCVSSMSEKKFTFQVWGQFVGRTDFIYPLSIDIPDSLTSNFDGELMIEDQTIEDAINKVLQVSFDQEDAQHELVVNANGHYRLCPYRITSDTVATLRVNNIGEITKTIESPMIIDRIRVKGKIYDSLVVTGEPECMYENEETLTCPETQRYRQIVVEFDEPVEAKSIEIRNLEINSAAKVWILEKNINFCIINLHNTTDNDLNKRTPKIYHIEIWARPLNMVTYQEDYVGKTPINVSGKYSYTEAEVENELITSRALADAVSTYEVIKSANKQLYYEPADCPANPAIQKGDTVLIVEAETGADQKGIVDDATFTFDTSGDGPELTMNLKAIPFDRFRTGKFSSHIWVDSHHHIDSDAHIDSRSDISVWLNVLFGDKIIEGELIGFGIRTSITDGRSRPAFGYVFVSAWHLPFRCQGSGS